MRNHIAGYEKFTIGSSESARHPFKILLDTTSTTTLKVNVNPYSYVLSNINQANSYTIENLSATFPIVIGDKIWIECDVVVTPLNNTISNLKLYGGAGYVYKSTFTYDSATGYSSGTINLVLASIAISTDLRDGYFITGGNPSSTVKIIQHVDYNLILMNICASTGDGRSAYFFPFFGKI